MNVGAKNLGDRFLFAVDHMVDPADQAEIIRIVRQEGRPFRGHHSHPDVKPFWLWVGLAEPDPGAVPKAGLQWLASRDQRLLSQWGYFARLDESASWVWSASQAVPIVRRILEPLTPLYKRITKVNVILQVPGQPLNAHRDLAVGNTYNLISPYHWAVGPEPMKYEGETWLHKLAPIRSIDHAQNGYLCLKVPLSERPDDPGNPFVELEGSQHFYTSRGRVFFLNEVEMLHGADPAPFWRGVVFVNGILDMDRVRSAPKIPVEVLRTRPAPHRPPPESGYTDKRDRTLGK